MCVLTMVAVRVMVLDEFSKWLLTSNAHRPHSIAKVIESTWQPAVVGVSYAFVAAAVGLSTQNHCPKYPVTCHEIEIIVIHPYPDDSCLPTGKLKKKKQNE